ncbi:hypothetical protein Dda_3300 [Drechslerella dactyloides]|uniref:Uncharacterized protein n=1 Tax=Drechslerella dactyloides TaxID=74499 RepID=A0AAD6J1C7_DREDA|nr:hypothetical protein Dda_3300 [Drechslerella dactyloides]
MSAAAEQSLAKSIGGSFLKGAGKTLASEAGGMVLNMALSELGINLGNDDSAAFAQLNQKLDHITKQLDTLESELASDTISTRVQLVNQSANDLKNKFEKMISEVKSYASATNSDDRKSRLGFLMTFRNNLVGDRIGTDADNIHDAMCGSGSGGSLLREKWKDIKTDEKFADPLDAYKAMKKFSFKYQKALGHAASLLKFIAYTQYDPANPKAKPSQQQIENSNPWELREMRKIEKWMGEWDELLETGSNPVIDRIIYKMASAWMVDEGRGQIGVFWDRSGGHGVKIRKNINVGDEKRDMIGLGAQVYTLDDWLGTLYILRDNKAGDYYLQFPKVGGRRDVGLWLPNRFHRIWDGDKVATLADQEMHNKLVDGKHAALYAQPFKLRIIAKPGDKDGNVWFHILLAAPAPICSHWNSDYTKNHDVDLKRYMLQATAEGQELMYFNDGCEDQYDTQFSFRLPS